MADESPSWLVWVPQLGGAVMALGGLITALRGILSDGPGVLGKLRDGLVWCWSHGTPWGRAMMAHHEARMTEVAALRRQVAELQRAWDGEDTDVETTQTRDQLAARLLLQLQELLNGRD